MIALRPISAVDTAALHDFLLTHWGAAEIVAHGTVYTAANLAGFVAEEQGAWLGVATYRIADGACELVTLDSLREKQGIGGALLAAVAQIARDQGCTRLWLITTNDNLRALGFYQRRGLVLVQVHREAVTRARQIKPTIPLVSADGIPIRDEIELELLL